MKSGEAVGIVGRTGSGKSSLIVALFRLAEPHRGGIMLDGHNLLGLGLQVSRLKGSLLVPIPESLLNLLWIPHRACCTG